MRKNNKWLIIFFVLTLMSCSKENKVYPMLPDPITVLSFGDSITYGYGANKGQDYPSRLAAITGWKVINAGVCGERSDQAKFRIAQVLQETQPQLVIIEIGGNDFLQLRSEKDIKQDIKSIIQTVKKENIPMALVAVPNLSWMEFITNKPTDATLYKSIAEEEKIILIPYLLSNILEKKELKFDQIHPNARGYKLMAEGIAERFKTIGLW